jgi:hypothetical protein
VTEGWKGGGEERREREKGRKGEGKREGGIEGDSEID